jgi:hypothetical protein
MRNWADVETNPGQSESEITGSARMTTETDAFPGVSRVTSRVKIVPLASSTDFWRRCQKLDFFGADSGAKWAREFVPGLHFFGVV